MKKNILYIKHHNLETETFKLIEPECNLYIREYDDGKKEFVVYFDAIQLTRIPEMGTSNDDLEISFDASIVLEENFKMKKNIKMFQEEGYDYDIDENLSNFYYNYHSNIEFFKVKVIEVNTDYLILTIEGKTFIDNANGDLPDAELFVFETKFMINKKLTRGIQ